MTEPVRLRARSPIARRRRRQGDSTAWPRSRSWLLEPPLRSPRRRSAVDRLIDTVRPGRRLVPTPPLASRTEGPDAFDRRASFTGGALRQLR